MLTSTNNSRVTRNGYPFYIYIRLKIKSMKQKVTALVANAREYVILGLAYLFAAFVICALLFQATMIVMDLNLMLRGQAKKSLPQRASSL